MRNDVFFSFVGFDLRAVSVNPAMDDPAQGRNSRKNYDGGGGTLTLKNTDIWPIWYPKKYRGFSFSNTDIFKRIIVISFVIHRITHFILILLICFI